MIVKEERIGWASAHAGDVIPKVLTIRGLATDPAGTQESLVGERLVVRRGG